MPFVIPFIPLIAAGVSAGTEIGLTLSNQPSSGDQTRQLQEQQQKQAQADAESKRKAILAQMANAQGQAGGALNAPSLTELAAVIAGLPGEGTTNVGQRSLASYLGLPQAGEPTNPIATPNQPSSGNMVNTTYGLSGSMD